MKKGDLIKLEISKYAYEGKGISKIDKANLELNEENIFVVNQNSENNNYVIFVHGSYPGDEVIARLIKIKGSYAEAKTEKILKASSERTDYPCKYFGVCGGCKQQDLDYASQLKYKQEQVKDIFERLGGFSDFEFLDIIPSEKIFHYRNKMEFSFADKRWLTKDEIGNEEITDRNFALGLHIPKMFDKVLDIDQCFLQPEIGNSILNFTREFFKSRNATIYSTKTHEGYLRNLVLKNTHHTDDLMLNLVTSEENDELMKEYTSQILKEIPQITTIVNNINKKMSQVAFGDYEIIYHGNGNIYDTIGKYKFRISANSFFQTNTLQAEKLYQAGLDFAELKGDEIVYDLYSGAGTISIFVSGNAKKVYAFETVESSIKDAAENKKMNGISNVHFHTVDLNRSFLNYLKGNSIPKPDVVILDPPRSGMNPVTVNDIIQLSPRKIVYISCNPATQARDVKLFSEANYKLKKVRPVDMFPHTYHIENVVLMELED